MGLIGNQFTLNTGVRISLGDVYSRTPGNFSRYPLHCYTNTQEGNTSVYTGNANSIGSYPSSSFVPPQQAGQMAMRTTGEGNFSGDLIPTYPMSIAFTGSGELEATAGLVVSMSMNMDGSGSLTASIQGRIAMEASFTGSGDLTASMSGIANMLIDMLGQGDLDATISAYGNMTLDITVTGTGLTIENVAAAVWNASRAQFTESGTMGEALNDAGSAGNPWAALLVDNNDPGTFGERVQKLLTMSKFIGLK